MDTEYLKSQLGRCLVECLTEVSEKRPLDPIEYMGQWLYKFMENEEHKKQEGCEQKQLEEETVAYAAEQERQARMAEEKLQLAKEESERKKALEAEQAAQAAEEHAAGLATVVEKEEPAEQVVADPGTEEQQEGEEAEPSGEEGVEEPGEGVADGAAEEAAQPPTEEPTQENPVQEEPPAE